MLAGQVELTLETMEEEPEVEDPKKAAKGKKHSREAGEDHEDDDFEQPSKSKQRKAGASQPTKEVWLKVEGVWLKVEWVWLKEDGVYSTGWPWIVRCEHGQGHQGGIT